MKNKMKSIIQEIHPKCILLSVQPRHTANIFDLLKTIEWRKKPLPLGHYYCYETKGKTDFPTWIDEDGHCIFEGRGEVIGEFDIVKNNKVQLIDLLLGKNALLENGCVGYEFLVKYAKKQDYLWANDIANVKKFDKPKALSEFKRSYRCELPKRTDELCCSIENFHCFYEILVKITTAPQNYCYCEELEEIK